VFRCGRCNSISQPGEPATRQVVETRERVYTRRFWYVNRHGRILRGEDAKQRGRERKDFGGVGREIVREENWCRPCAGLPAFSPAPTLLEKTTEAVEKYYSARAAAVETEASP